MTPLRIDPRELRDDLRAQVSPAVRDVLDRIITAANVPVFAVGGAVRDAIIGRPVHDIDLVAACDAIDLFRMALPAVRATVHARFRTTSAVVGGARIDVATARSETYARPGALPKVAPADIVADLRRRDFAVNAIALRLSGDAALVDPCGGIADMARRHIRVLHERSFVDDPTRIFRALRYAERLDFVIEPHTVELLRQAVPHIGALSGERARREIELVLREPSASGALAAAARHGVLREVHSALAWSEEAGRGLDGEPGLLAQRLPLGFALLASHASVAESVSITARLRLHRGEAAAVASIAALASSARVFKRPEVKPSGVVVVFDRHPAAAVAAFSATASDYIARELAHRYLAEWRHVKPLLSGRDLQDLGVPEGPQIQRGLQLIRAARLDGWAGDHGDERALAMRFAKSIRDSGAMNATIDLRVNGN